MGRPKRQALCFVFLDLVLMLQYTYRMEYDVDLSLEGVQSHINFLTYLSFLTRSECFARKPLLPKPNDAKPAELARLPDSSASAHHARYMCLLDNRKDLQPPSAAPQLRYGVGVPARDGPTDESHMRQRVPCALLITQKSPCFKTTEKESYVLTLVL